MMRGDNHFIWQKTYRKNSIVPDYGWMLVSGPWYDYLNKFYQSCTQGARVVFAHTAPMKVLAASDPIDPFVNIEHLSWYPCLFAVGYPPRRVIYWWCENGIVPASLECRIHSGDPWVDDQLDL